MPPDPAIEREGWIALASVSGIGDVTFERLLTIFGSAASALDAIGRMRVADGDRRLARSIGMRVDAGLHGRVLAAARDPERTSREMARLGGWMLTPFDDGYPHGLGAIEDPPRVLFGLGERAATANRRRVAIVGTRRATATGRVLAARVATRLVEAHCTIVSGLAVGIDAVAHAATVEARGQTVAVVGGGLDSPGPVANRRLARAILDASGAIVGEHPPGVRPTRGTFPRRNRIISALARGTIVVEAPARSGALITARHALEQGRTLLVAPGRPGDAAVAGCLAFLRETPAQPLVGLDEMIVDLGLDVPVAAPEDAVAGLSTAAALLLLPPTECKVAKTLVEGPQTVDGIAGKAGVDPGVVAGALTMLQMRGWARVHGSIQLAAGPLLDTSGTSAPIEGAERRTLG